MRILLTLLLAFSLSSCRLSDNTIDGAISDSLTPTLPPNTDNPIVNIEKSVFLAGESVPIQVDAFGLEYSFDDPSGFVNSLTSVLSIPSNTPSQIYNFYV